MFKVKKRSTLILIISLITILSSFFIVFNTFAANSCGGANTVLIECDEGGTGGIYHVLSLIIDIFTIGVGILAVIGISWAGIQYLTAKDDTTKTTKAKRRIYEIVLGLIAYVLLWSGAQWLLPNGKLNPNQMEKSAITISVNGKQKVGITFTPKVSFEKDISDKSYSLTSSNSSIISTLSTVAKCADEGTATITATTASGEKNSATVTCEEEDNDSPTDNNHSDSQSDSKKGFETVGSQADTKMKKKKPKMRKETRDIVNDHKKDFFYTGKKSYKKVVKGKNSKYGSYKKYVKSLGGVFEQFADKKKIKVKTAADLQLASEYFWGLYTIWGPDYKNGNSTYTNSSNQWQGSDAFYAGYSGRSSSLAYTKGSSINDVLGNYSTKLNINTNCNKTIHMFMNSTSLKYINTGAGKSNIKRKLKGDKFYKSQLIYNVEKLKVGDLINFTICNTTYGHVVMVGEVYKDYIVVYDGGSKFMKNRQYKFKIPRRKTTSGDRMPGNKYSSYCSWYGYRPWKIDQSITLGGLN